MKNKFVDNYNNLLINCMKLMKNNQINII